MLQLQVNEIINALKCRTPVHGTSKGSAHAHGHGGSMGAYGTSQGGGPGGGLGGYPPSRYLCFSVPWFVMGPLRAGQGIANHACAILDPLTCAIHQNANRTIYRNRTIYPFLAENSAIPNEQLKTTDIHRRHYTWLNNTGSWIYVLQSVGGDGQMMLCIHCSAEQNEVYRYNISCFIQQRYM